jgi:hypothetical protein
VLFVPFCGMTSSVWSFDSSAAEELLQCRIDIFLVVDSHAYESLFVFQTVIEDRKQGT